MLVAQRCRRLVRPLVRLTSSKPTSATSISRLEARDEGTSVTSLAELTQDVLLNTRFNKPHASTDSIWVGHYKGFPHMLYVLNIVRYFEQHYGKVREFQVLRDENIPEIYRNYMLISFVNPAVLDALFEKSPEPDVQIPIPSYETRAGGPSLEDVMPFLAPYKGPIKPVSKEWLTVAEELLQKTNTSQGSGSTGSSVDETVAVVKLKRNAFKNLPSTQKYKLEARRRYILSEDTYTSLAKAYLAFGGFHPDSSSTDPEAERGSSKNEPMRQTMRKYKHYLERLESGEPHWQARHESRRVSVDDPALNDRGIEAKDWSSNVQDDGRRSGPVVKQTSRRPGDKFRYRSSSEDNPMSPQWYENPPTPYDMVDNDRIPPSLWEEVSEGARDAISDLERTQERNDSLNGADAMAEVGSKGGIAGCR